MRACYRVYGISFALILAIFLVGASPTFRTLEARFATLETTVQALATRLGVLETSTALLPEILGLLESVETNLVLLQQEVQELAAAYGHRPVVIDANGHEVGTWSGNATVLFSFDGLPPFILNVWTTRLTGVGGSTIGFESSDCSGVPMAMVDDNPSPLRPSFYNEATGETWLNPLVGGSSRALQSSLLSTGECEPSQWQATVAPAIPIPQLTGAFSPPFTVVLRSARLR